MKGLNAMIKGYAIHHYYVSTATALLVCFFQCGDDTFKCCSFQIASSLQFGTGLVPKVCLLRDKEKPWRRGRAS